MKNEIVAYYRVSTKAQGIDGLGMEAQKRAVAAHAARVGFPIVAEYAEVETGRKDDLRNRPQLVRALGHARRSGAIVVIARIDRLARSVFVTSQLLASGVEFVACDNPHANRMTIQILAVMAEHEGRLISERTKAGLAAARARGVVFGPGRAFTPEERRRGQLAAVEARMRRTREVYADLVPLARELFDAEGATLASIAGALNELGHRTQRGSAWGACTVRMLGVRESLAPLRSTLCRRGSVADEIRTKGVIASRAAYDARARRVAASVADAAIAIKAPAGTSWAAVARELNRRGFRNADGRPWVHGTLLRLLRRFKLVTPKAPRHEVSIGPAAIGQRRAAAIARTAPYLAIVEHLLAMGRRPREIAETLNELGYLPPRSERWQRTHIVQLILRTRRWRKTPM